MKNTNSNKSSNKTENHCKSLNVSSLFKRLTAIFGFVAAIILFSPENAAAQSNCGRAGQRPCRVWERIPSCNKGLVENFARDICVAKTPCGGLNQRACKIYERIPSCNNGLAEYGGKCVSLDPDREKTIVRFCNSSWEPTVYAAFAFWDKNAGWVSKGWYTIARNSCRNVTIANNYRGKIYVFGTNEDDSLNWGGDYNFYVNWNDGFELVQNKSGLRYDNRYRQVGMQYYDIVPGVNTWTFRAN